MGTTHFLVKTGLLDAGEVVIVQSMLTLLQMQDRVLDRCVMHTQLNTSSKCASLRRPIQHARHEVYISSAKDGCHVHDSMKLRQRVSTQIITCNALDELAKLTDLLHILAGPGLAVNDDGHGEQQEEDVRTVVPPPTIQSVIQGSWRHS